MKKITALLHRSASLTQTPPQPQDDPLAWASWAGRSLGGVLAWFLGTLRGRVALIPLLVLTLLTSYLGENVALLGAGAYAAVTTGLALRSGWSVAISGPWRSRLFLLGALLGVLLVSMAAFMLLGAALSVAVSVGVALLVLYVLYRLVRLFSGTSNTTSNTASVGEVWLVEVPNDNPDEPEAFKVRPAVVLSTTSKSLTVAYATSQEKRYRQNGYIEVTDLPGWPTSDGKRSFLNVGQTLRTSPRALVKKKTTLPTKSFRSIAAVVS